jgi:hypothetical protein
MQNNQKKLMAQKIFIEKQLTKDLKDIQQNYARLELELKKDDVIKTNLAVGRIQRLTQMMTTSYSYITQVVGFMVFDQDSLYEQPDHIDDEQMQAMIKEKNEAEAASQLLAPNQVERRTSGMMMGDA